MSKSKLPTAIGLALAASLTLSACGDAGAAEALAQTQAELAAAHATLDAYNAVLAEAQAQEAAEAAEAEAARQANLINVEEIPLFEFVNSSFTIAGDRMFEQVDPQSQSLRDYVITANIPWWWQAGLFFLNTSTLEPLNEPFGDLAPAGSFVIEMNPNQAEINDTIGAYQDIANGIPMQMRFMDTPDKFYFAFQPVDSIQFSGTRIVSALNDDGTISVQVAPENALGVVEAAIVEPETEWGSPEIHIFVNQGAATNSDIAWQLSSANQTLPNVIRIVDAQTETTLFSTSAGEQTPAMLEIRLIPELMQSAREFAIQGGLSWFW